MYIWSWSIDYATMKVSVKQIIKYMALGKPSYLIESVT